MLGTLRFRNKFLQTVVSACMNSKKKSRIPGYQESHTSSFLSLGRINCR